jgi:hypothetical protein
VNKARKVALKKRRKRKVRLQAKQKVETES